MLVFSFEMSMREEQAAEAQTQCVYSIQCSTGLGVYGEEAEVGDS